MIDTHAHLDFPEFDQDRREVISRAFDNGVRAIINVGVDLERSRKSVELAEKHEGVFASVGLHPDYFTKHITSNTKQDWMEKLKKLAQHEKVVAIGECGLDYFRIIGGGEIKGVKERQKEGFLRQIEIAKELNLPVIVHCREAWDDLHEIISSINKDSIGSKLDFSLAAKKFSQFLKVELCHSSKPNFEKFVLHCYSGEKKDTERFLKLPNIFFSFSGNITYPKPRERAEKLAEVVRMIPLDKIMLDSDSPFLAPQEKRGKRNEPIFVNYIAKKIAQIKRVSELEVDRITDENAINFFGLSLGEGYSL